ncbi:MAG: hypothetical protein ILP01_00215 [Clostridia bacterium]|nr:hypothetical protein [Clostridia bacterium]
MKKTAAFLSLFFAAAIVLSAASCAGKPDSATGDTTLPSSEATAESSVEESTALTVDYGGETAVILGVSEQAKQFYVDTDAGQTGDMLKDALYERILHIQDRLNLKLEFVFENGNWDHREAFISKVEASVKDGSGAYDVIAAYNLNPPVMATKGLLMNLGDAPHLDFSQPWYSRDFVDTVSVGNNIYYAINIADYGSVRQMASVMFDKSLTSVKGITDSELYAKVLDGGWTLEELLGYIDGTFAEMNGTNAPDYGDVWGFAVGDKPRIDALFYGFGLQIVSKQPDGALAMALGDEKNQTVIETINSLLYRNDNVYSIDNSLYGMFKANKVYFYLTPIAIVDQKLGFDFGVLPVPKLNSDQQNYRTYISNQHEAWCIPEGSLTYDMGTDVIELFGYEANERIAPVYFETMLKYRYSSDDGAAKVYDIIRSSVIFDFGYMFGNSFSNNPFLLFRNRVTDKQTDWTSYYSRYSKMFNSELAKIVASVENPVLAG